jgi:hypothetical protein
MNIRPENKVLENIRIMASAPDMDTVVDQFGLGYGHVIFALNRGLIEPEEFAELVKALRHEFVNGINRLEESENVEKLYSAYG